MDELEISGRRYISSVRAAKEHKYHSDYIGQLVRGGKVVGQKVGRAWYVDADSLSEYLGKEVPARGPMPKAIKPEPVEEVIQTPAPEVEVVSQVQLVEEPVEIEEQVEEDAVTEDVVEEIPEPVFVMPLRKSGRQHVIEAISSKKESEQKIVEPAVQVEMHVEEPAEKELEDALEERVEVFVADMPEEVALPEEETYIPLKITKQPVQDLYTEPEDSFYKISRKGLKYVTPQNTESDVQERGFELPVTVRPAKKASSTSTAKIAVTASILLVVGVMSLGAGLLMSYYLHSMLTVQGESQTSSVILGN